MPAVTPETLTRTVQDFLSEAASAVVLENGAVAFDLAQSRYSISGEYNRCLLHLWSNERNAVRRVLEAEVKNGTLRLAVQKLGQARPSKLEICRERDRRTPTARRSARVSYEQTLRRTLERHFPDLSVTRITGSVDLEKSFGPVYARGVIRQGRSAFAVLGVNATEAQASVDAALTFGILWLDVCRQTQASNQLIEGLKLFVPHRTSALVRERMANLNRDAAKWSLFELNERDDALLEIDCTDRGNVATRLVQVTDESAARERFAESIVRIQQILPNCEIAVLSPAEIVFRWRGLEFARARFRRGARLLRKYGGNCLWHLRGRAGSGSAERIRTHRTCEWSAQYSSSLWTAPTSTMASAPGEVARVARRARCKGRRRPPASILLLFAGSRVLCCRPRHGRRAHDDSPRTPRARRTQSRRRYSSSAARARLLVARGMAPRSRGVPALWIFRRPRVICRETTPLSCRSGAACAPCYRYFAALYLA
jgi:hypothetical protein